jgi:biotin carboxyl carrier protein
MAGGDTWIFSIEDPFAEDDSTIASVDRLLAPMPGKIVRVFARAGEMVKRGQPLVVLEAMKMESTLVAPADAEVTALVVAVGDQVDGGAIVVRFALPRDSAAT